MIKSNNYRTLINIIGFYVCWWLSIYGAIQEKYFLGSISLLVYMAIHFMFINSDRREYFYILICLFLGFFFDTMLLNLNIIEYRGYLPSHYSIAPLWVATLWVCFGLTIFHSFRMLQQNYRTSMIMGFFSGPFILYSFSKIRIITLLHSEIVSLIFFSFLWMLIIPLYVYIADRLIDDNGK